MVELVVIVALALGLALAIQAWLIKPYQIPSQSMEPTLDVGQRVLVNRFLYHFTDPGIGDIVVFHPPAGADSSPPAVARRSAPASRSTSACPARSRPPASRTRTSSSGSSPAPATRSASATATRSSTASRRADESFIRPCGTLPACNLPKQITIPPDHYFMMGDNRGESDDSRFWGPVPRDWIIGKAFATYWPPDRVGVF